MIISDLEYLNSVADSDTNSAVNGGFSHPSRFPFQYTFLFDREFKKDKFTGRSRGGYLTNDNGETIGIFSMSQISSY